MVEVGSYTVSAKLGNPTMQLPDYVEYPCCPKDATVLGRSGTVDDPAGLGTPIPRTHPRLGSRIQGLGSRGPGPQIWGPGTHSPLFITGIGTWDLGYPSPEGSNLGPLFWRNPWTRSRNLAKTCSGSGPEGSKMDHFWAIFGPPF